MERMRKAAALLAILLAATALPVARAEEEKKDPPPPIEESWNAVDETPEAEAPARQARASIYRGDHLVALRCHREGDRNWESLVFGATWFLRPKSHLTFELSVDGGEALVVEFQRETDYRFSTTNPPRQLIEALGGGNALTIGGPDFDGTPVVVPLKGSRVALEQAFDYCGYDPLTS